MGAPPLRAVLARVGWGCPAPDVPKGVPETVRRTGMRAKYAPSWRIGRGLWTSGTGLSWRQSLPVLLPAKDQGVCKVILWCRGQVIFSRAPFLPRAAAGVRTVTVRAMHQYGAFLAFLHAAEVYARSRLQTYTQRDDYGYLRGFVVPAIRH